MSGIYCHKDVSNSANTSTSNAVSSASGPISIGQMNAHTSAPRIVMPRPVVLNAVGPNPCLLAAVRASSSECSELSSITRSIEPATASQGGRDLVAAVCRRCLSHASSASPSAGGCGGGGGDNANSTRNRGSSTETEDTEAFERRPKTEPQAYYDTFNSRINLLDCSNTRYVTL